MKLQNQVKRIYYFRDTQSHKGTAAHTCNPITWEDQGGGLPKRQGYPELQWDPTEIKQKCQDQELQANPELHETLSKQKHIWEYSKSELEKWLSD